MPGNDLTMHAVTVGGVFVYMHDRSNLRGMKKTITVARAWSQAKLRPPELEIGEARYCVITYV